MEKLIYVQLESAIQSLRTLQKYYPDRTFAALVSVDTERENPFAGSLMLIGEDDRTQSSTDAPERQKRSCTENQDLALASCAKEIMLYNG